MKKNTEKAYRTVSDSGRTWIYSECGRQINLGSIYCEHCGKKLIWEKK